MTHVKGPHFQRDCKIVGEQVRNWYTAHQTERDEATPATCEAAVRANVKLYNVLRWFYGKYQSEGPPEFGEA